jgi:hypothetical protein
LPHYYIGVAIVAAGLTVNFNLAYAAAPVKMERVFRDVERSLCRSLKLSGCQKKTRQRKKTAGQNRVVKKRVSKPAAPTPKESRKAEPARKPTPGNGPPPVPRHKPSAPPTPETARGGPPLPREKPAKMADVATAGPVSDQITQAQRRPEPPTISTPLMESAGASDCRAKLAALGARFAAVTGDVGTGQCRVARPVKLSTLRTGTANINFPDGPMLDCGFAVTFIEWLKDTGAPIARAQANSPIAKLWTGPGYECRGRNGDISAKISEHGFGNAVDITGFQLEDGRLFEVKEALNPLSPAHATLKGLRGSACGYFTTVLGPGANAAHETHFHFDMGKHGASGNYRICE